MEATKQVIIEANCGNVNLCARKKQGTKQVNSKNVHK